jgi:hypothetical protein
MNNYIFFSAIELSTGGNPRSYSTTCPSDELERGKGERDGGKMCAHVGRGCIGLCIQHARVVAAYVCVYTHTHTYIHTHRQTDTDTDTDTDTQMQTLTVSVPAGTRRGLRGLVSLDLVGGPRKR